ncbi:hypothetical protein [Nitriliruptor alkaliphilus]|uniref:hypothetical protein n=1 Tax=Nitriliruptor alkaliphilus TaxID=427918 RepID=UPI000698DED5|nr:hypothetical protein [Nitriliruptor alkaliphilus]
MSDKYAKHRRNYTDVLQKHVGATSIQVIGCLSQPGSLAGAALAKVSGAGFLANRAAGNKKAGGDLPTNVMVAVTDDAIHLFDFRPKGSSIKVKDEVAVWPRATTRVHSAKEGTLATRLVIDLEHERHTIELDANAPFGLGKAFNQPLLDVLHPSPQA